MLSLLLLMQGAASPPPLSPRVAAMLPGFPAPVQTDVSITTRFSADTVYTGEQVELVTATWFARDLLVLLRRQPSLRAPTLSGLWSTQPVSFPSLTLSRVANNRIVDLYITHQTLFPLGASTITAPPAELTYAVPTSTSFFAPEERRVLRSRPAQLVVRPIPAHLAAALGNGPTARGVTLTWRGPATGIVAGTPAPIELVVRGTGNVTLWPTPDMVWSTAVHVYPETTQEQTTTTDGLVSGEKRFRFTVVVDSQGVLSLPAVRYPYFDARRGEVLVATAPAAVLPVQPGAGPAAARSPLALAPTSSVPWATQAQHRGRGVLWVLVLLPLALGLTPLWRRARQGQAPVTPDDPALQVRRALATMPDVVPTLRRRGVARHDAEQVARWLAASERHRFGPSGSAAPDTPQPLLQRVVARLRRAGWVGLWLLLGGTPLAAQQDGVAAYQNRAYPEAVRAFAAAAAEEPLRPSHWQRLGAAAWAAGDEVGAAAAWLRGLALAPRDAALRHAWQQATTLPERVRQAAPTVPLSRDEMLLLALVAWLAAAGCWWRRRRAPALILLAVAVGGAGLAAARTWRSGRAEVLTRAAVLRVSPTPTAPVVGEVPVWTRALVRRRMGAWYLLEVPHGPVGWAPAAQLAELGVMPAQESVP